MFKFQKFKFRADRGRTKTKNINKRYVENANESEIKEIFLIKICLDDKKYRNSTYSINQ